MSEDTTVETGMACALAEREYGDPEILRDLAAAARTLGDWWLEDRATFSQVSMATGRILEILQVSRAMSVARPHSNEPLVIFASVPGEQHTIGVRIAADLFRGDGWGIACKIGLSQEELVSEIGREPGCIVGLSIGGRHSLDALSRLVEALRKTCTPAALVVCGHHVHDIEPQLSLLELDGIASEINESKVKISALWDREYEATAIRRTDISTVCP